MVIRVLGVIMCFLLCCSFISMAVGYSGELNVINVLDRLSELDYDLVSVRRLIADISTGFNFDTYVFWDDTLTGVGGFITNVGNFIPTVWQYLFDVIVTVVGGFWHLVIDSLQLVLTLLDACFILFGFEW